MSRAYKQDFRWAPADNSDQRPGDLGESYPSLSASYFPESSVGPEGAEFWYHPGGQQHVTLHQNYMAMSHNNLVPTTGLESPTTIKHRRTRSGCFTCRQRRVKCDETRPVCERCRKGNRQCDFPQASASSKRAAKDTASGSERKDSLQEQTASEGATTEDEEEDEEGASDSRPITKEVNTESLLEATAMGSRKASSNDSPTVASPISLRHSFNTADDDTQTRNARFTPRSATSRGQQRPVWITRPDLELKWNSLDCSVQECLIFQQKHLSYHHYFLPCDSANFVHEEYIERALSFDPLLYAVVTFAAYHRTVQEADGQFTSFWKFYSKSIILLRQYLATNAERNEQLLLTILQLALFEEYLGDWTNMSTHLRAAQSMWTTLCTLDTAFQQDVTQKMFHWIGRISLISSMVANSLATFERKWFVGCLQSDQLLHEADRSNLDNAISYFNSSIRLQAFDIADFLARANKDSMPAEQFLRIGDSLEMIRRDLHEYHDPEYVVSESRLKQSTMQTDWSRSLLRSIPVYRAHLWPFTYLWASWVSLKQVYVSLASSKPQASGSPTEDGLTPGHQVTDVTVADLEDLALTQFRIFDTVRRWLDAPAGAEFCCHGPMSFAALFLKRTTENVTWARQSLATVERMGYVWLPSLRLALADKWQIPELIDWWLPNGQGRSSLLDEIRGVVEERNREKGERGTEEEQMYIYDTKTLAGRLGIES